MEIKEVFQNKIFTVSEFNDFVNGVLRPAEVWVEGEISDWRVSQNKFIWFNLKDEEQTLQCFTMAFRIHQPVEDGMKVRVFGYPRIHGKSGRFSFFVEVLELTGEGSLKRSFELLRKKLEAEGLFALERKRPLPRFPRVVGLITSRDAAAYTDFIKHLNLRLGGLEIKFIPTAVQGANAIPDIVRAFEYFNHHFPDVIAMVRGGGSLEDLQAFNSEDVARAVFSAKVPVVAGIGHERDITLAELAADVRASTPTAAAQEIAPDREELLGQISRLLQTQHYTVDSLISFQQHRWQQLLVDLRAAAFAPAAKINAALIKLRFVGQRLQNQIKMAAQRLSNQRQLLLSLSPEATLSRGYSIVRKNGKIITSAKAVAAGDGLTVTLSKGSLESQVKKVIL